MACVMFCICMQVCRASRCSALLITFLMKVDAVWMQCCLSTTVRVFVLANCRTGRRRSSRRLFGSFTGNDRHLLWLHLIFTFGDSFVCLFGQFACNASPDSEWFWMLICAESDAEFCILATSSGSSSLVFSFCYF